MVSKKKIMLLKTVDQLKQVSSIVERFFLLLLFTALSTMLRQIYSLDSDERFDDLQFHQIYKTDFRINKRLFEVRKMVFIHK